MKCYVYAITHSASGRIYIGKTNNPDHRWYTHRRLARNGDTRVRKLYAAMRYYGVDAFDFRVVEESNSDEEAFDREVWWVSFCRSNVSGFNLDSGGRGGSKKSPESIEKQAAQMRGRTFSDEHRRKLSEAHAGKKRRPCSEETRRKISIATMGVKKSPAKTPRARGFERGPMSDDTRQKLRNANLGKTLSDAHRQKLSESHRGKPWSDLRRASFLAKKREQ